MYSNVDIEAEPPQDVVQLSVAEIGIDSSLAGFSIPIATFGYVPPCASGRLIVQGAQVYEKTLERLGGIDAHQHEHRNCDTIGISGVSVLDVTIPCPTIFMAPSRFN